MLGLSAIDEPRWHHDAQCASQPWEWFFPDRGQTSTVARQICDGCPVKAECLEDGLFEYWGVWGGTVNDERRAIRRERGLPEDMSKLLSTPELADELGVPEDTIKNWRYRGGGPDFLKLGRHIRYEREAVNKWLEAQTVVAA